ncbi:MAG: hypothetical protein AAF975_07655, partial [Spirochaetota bacterium]
MQPERILSSYPQLYKSSILIEIRNKDEIVEAIVFPVPPEGIKVDQGYRKTITQTFGGAIIDHFGLALGRIQITGHTGGPFETRYIIGGKNKQKEGPYNSGQAAEKILKRIINFPIASKTKDNYAQLEIRLYDFTGPDSHRVLSFVNGYHVRYTPPTAYIISLDNYSVSRNANKYGFFQYTIDATILSYFGEYRQKQFKKLTFIEIKHNKEDVFNILDALDEALLAIDGVISDIASAINTGRAVVRQVQNTLGAIQSK